MTVKELFYMNSWWDAGTVIRFVDGDEIYNERMRDVLMRASVHDVGDREIERFGGTVVYLREVKG